MRRGLRRDVIAKRLVLPANDCSRGWIKGHHVVALAALFASMLLLADGSPAAAGERKAVWVSATEPNLGVNVVRDDGRVVAYFDVDGVKGPRVIPGLDNIVRTTARLALRRDGVVLTWTPECGKNPPHDVEHDYCEYRAARAVPGLRKIVAISEWGGGKLALDRDGTVWGWGDDSDGVISGRPAVPREVGKPFKRRMVAKPTRIPLHVPMAHISVGAVQAGAVDREGRAWTWGGKRFPDVEAPGDDVSEPNGFVARRVSGVPALRTVEVLGDAYAVTTTGDVWRWGVSRVNGARGSSAPSRLPNVTDIVAVSLGNAYAAMMDTHGMVLFVGIAPDKPNNLGQWIDEPHATKLMPRAVAISAGARITREGAVLYFSEIRSGLIQYLDLAD